MQIFFWLSDHPRKQVQKRTLGVNPKVAIRALSSPDDAETSTFEDGTIEIFDPSEDRKNGPISYYYHPTDPKLAELAANRQLVDFLVSTSI